jgi:hypothetical protein
VTWVLILDSSYTAAPAAVIGGYATREEAEQAGDLATAFGPYVPATEGSPPSQEMPYWVRYTVIPGAAASGPLGATHSHLQRADYDIQYLPSGMRPHEITRVTRRFP